MSTPQPETAHHLPLNFLPSHLANFCTLGLILRCHLCASLHASLQPLSAAQVPSPTSPWKHSQAPPDQDRQELTPTPLRQAPLDKGAAGAQLWAPPHCSPHCPQILHLQNTSTCIVLEFPSCPLEVHGPYYSQSCAFRQKLYNTCLLLVASSPDNTDPRTQTLTMACLHAEHPLLACLHICWLPVVSSPSTHQCTLLRGPLPVPLRHSGLSVVSTAHTTICTWRVVILDATCVLSVSSSSDMTILRSTARPDYCLVTRVLSNLHSCLPVKTHSWLTR